MKRTHPTHRGVLLGLAALAATTTLGCGAGDGPRLARVNGVVMLDGAPLRGAVVLFIPPGQPKSRGITNEQGEYELAYMTGLSAASGIRKGAVLGEHRVSIATMPDAGDSVSVPHAYNVDTQLSTDVGPGANQIDWELRSNPEGV